MIELKTSLFLVLDGSSPLVQRWLKSQQLRGAGVEIASQCSFVLNVKSPVSSLMVHESANFKIKDA